MRETYKNCNKGQEKEPQYKEACFIRIFFITSNFLPKKVQARERRKKVQCKLVCKGGCIVCFQLM